MTLYMTYNFSCALVRHDLGHYMLCVLSRYANDKYNNKALIRPRNKNHPNAMVHQKYN